MSSNLKSGTHSWGTSGFYLKSGNDAYIVTAGHVVNGSDAVEHPGLSKQLAAKVTYAEVNKNVDVGFCKSEVDVRNAVVETEDSSIPNIIQGFSDPAEFMDVFK